MTPVAVPALAPVLKPKLLGRLAGASRKPFRVWFPPQSPVRIEYSRELLRLLLPRQDGEYSSGVLYGTSTPGTLRVISARPRADLEPVGIFAARWCGEVFLTEPDILRLENMDQELESGAAIALVIAGGYGGFFVREPNGCMQTIQSYQEFPIRAPSLQPTRPARLLRLATQAARLKLVNFVRPLKFVKSLKFAKQLQSVIRAKLAKQCGAGWQPAAGCEPARSNNASAGEQPARSLTSCPTRHSRNRRDSLLAKQLTLVRTTRAKLVTHLKQVSEWMPVAIVGAAVVILTGCVFPPPYFSRSAPFTVQERDGQLRIALIPSALSPGARLQIVDGEERRSIAISPSLTSVVYEPRTHDVHITLVR